RGEAPVLATVPPLLLPDRHRRLERVDAPARGLEGLAPVRRADDDDDGGLGEVERPDAVQEGDATEAVPAGASGVGDLAQLGLDLLGVRLVLEARHAGPSLGVVADGSGEQ